MARCVEKELFEKQMFIPSDKTAGETSLLVGLMDAKDLLLKKRRLKVNSGNQTVFREDLWTVHEPLKLKFLDLTE